MRAPGQPKSSSAGPAPARDGAVAVREDEACVDELAQQLLDDLRRGRGSSGRVLGHPYVGRRRARADANAVDGGWPKRPGSVQARARARPSRRRRARSGGTARAPRRSGSAGRAGPPGRGGRGCSARARAASRAGSPSIRAARSATSCWPERQVADQRARLAERDLGAELELADLADVVQDRRAQQQVGVEPRVEGAGLERERGHGDGVLEQAAEIGVVAAARAGRAAQLGAEALVAQEGVEQRAQVGVVDLAREVLEEAVELLEVAVGDGQELGRVGGASSARRIALSSTWSSSRKRSTRPRTQTRSPRSNWPARKSASRNARAGIAPVRSRSSTAR